MRTTSSNVVCIQSIILMISLLLFSACSGSRKVSGETHVPLIASATTPSIKESPGADQQLTQANLDLRESFAFPKEIDPNKRFMFYLHGKIIEDQGLPAISPQYGEYRYEAILEQLQGYGYVVISEQRPRDADGTEYAHRVLSQVNDLLAAGVPPGSITVVGASKGAAIAAFVSNLVANIEVNFVLLGGCHQPLIDEWKQSGTTLSGNVLAIYDSADEYAASCQELFEYSEERGLGQHLEIVLQIGSGHGILYEPLQEWVLPTVEWADQEW